MLNRGALGGSGLGLATRPTRTLIFFFTLRFHTTTRSALLFKGSAKGSAFKANVQLKARPLKTNNKVPDVPVHPLWRGVRTYIDSSATLALGRYGYR